MIFIEKKSARGTVDEVLHLTAYHTFRNQYVFSKIPAELTILPILPNLLYLLPN